MGNKLGCSCTPLPKKGAYKYEDSPWQNTRRRDGHLLRLWAEVFHVGGVGGAVKWQRVSEDLVPVNVTCVQDSPHCVFHITAYNSQVDKILDVRLNQPGTRLGQASECFVYWKDSTTGDTWGLNFTSPLDARQFRECCSSATKFTRKASSSYSLKLDANSKNKIKSGSGGKRKPQSTPSSPSRHRANQQPSSELQCTCMTAESLHRSRNGRVRYTGAATLPRSTIAATRTTSTLSTERSKPTGSTAVTAASYNNKAAAHRAQSLAALSSSKSLGDAIPQPMPRTTSRQLSASGNMQQQAVANSRSRQAMRAAQYASRREQTKSMDYSTQPRPTTSTASSYHHQHQQLQSRSKSSDNVFEATQHDLGALSLDSNTLKRMLNPLPTSTNSSPDQPLHQRVGHAPLPHHLQQSHPHLKQQTSITSTASSSRLHQHSRRPRHAEAHRMSSSLGLHSEASYNRNINRGRDKYEGRRRSLERGMCLDMADHSPPSDHYLYDNLCYATTPSSSNENSDVPSSDEGCLTSLHRQHSQNQTSPTSRLLQEYESHLRQALARGLDAESYSLHTFEALLTQSMEDVVSLMKEVHGELEQIRREEQQLKSESSTYRGDSFEQRKSNTLPLASSSGLTSSLSMPPTARHLSVPNVDTSHTLLQQSSFESADSRVYLTSSEMSEDDRLSLTTAVSDDDDGNATGSPSRSRSSVTAASFNCTGAVRKAGFLSVKKWLLRRRHNVELAKKRGWKGYWVCLKGTTLLFYPCDNRDGRAIDSTPKHLIIVDGAIMQPIPEHPKRDYIFCLSTAFGDAYLFQAPCQVELENWIQSIHSACSAAFARHRGRTGTLHLLQEEIYRFEKEIESDAKLKHMAELQLTVVADGESRRTLTEQIAQWDASLERLHCEQFRLRCYVSSLQGMNELPNPKSLLSYVSKSSKALLNQLGVFTVSSFHAYICARSPTLLSNLLSGRGSARRSRSQSRTPVLSRSASAKHLSAQSLDGAADFSLSDKTIQVTLPEGNTILLGLRDHMTVEEVLWLACNKGQLSQNDHFLRFQRHADDYYVANRTDFFDALIFERVEVCPKVLYQVELCRENLDQLFGFSVEAELIENADHQDELCVYVSRIEEGSLAHCQGLMKGDELMVINGAIVADLDMMFIESVLQEELSLCLMMRSSRLEAPNVASQMRTTEDYIESLVCPPPPSDTLLSDEMIGKLIVPSPIWGSQERSPDTSGRPTPSPIPSAGEASLISSEQMESLFRVIEDSCKKTAEQVTEYCLAPEPKRHPNLGTATAIQAAQAAAAAAAQHIMAQPRSSAGAGVGSGGVPTTSKLVPEADRLRKVILELIETERTYVKHMGELVEWYNAAVQKKKPPATNEVSRHLNSLLENCLDPAKKEAFLTNVEIGALFGNIQDLVGVQGQFLMSLEEALAVESDFTSFDHPAQFKGILFAIGNSFLYYTDHFKLYSSFCASHSKAQKVLHPTDPNAALSDFLTTRTARGQHSFSLESYLIKPIQRILKYPLLLQQLKHLTDPVTEEHMHLAEALKGMERVAEHINEMQRIHEEYGAIFDHLYRQQQKNAKQIVDLSPGELLYYGGVEWLNISEFLGKIKKGLELHAMCFVFRSAVVFLCKERIRQKKKLMGGSAKGAPPEVEIIRYQVLVPVTEVQVRASTQKDSDGKHLWELIHLRSQMQRRSEKVYQLSNSTGEFRNAFLRTIRQIIRESVRNMTVPATKTASRDKPATLRRFGALQAFQQDSSSCSQTMTRTLSGKKKRQKAAQRHSTVGVPVAGDVALSDDLGSAEVGVASEESDDDDDDEDDDDTIRSACDPPPATRSQSVPLRGPNQGLSLSTTSTISTSSAKLIQASNTPVNYQPTVTIESGSPVWKPRGGEQLTREDSNSSGGNSQQFFVYEDCVGDAGVVMQLKQKRTPEPAQHLNSTSANKKS